MSKPAIAVAVLLFAAAVFSAVQTTGSEPASAPDPPATTPSTPSTPIPEAAAQLPRLPGPAPAAKPYGSTDDMAADLASAGLPCTDYTILEQNDPRLKEFALCDYKSAHNRYNLYVFRDADSRDKWMGSIATAQIPWVFGPNWIVVVVGDPASGPQRAELLQLAIGGQIAQVQF